MWSSTRQRLRLLFAITIAISTISLVVIINVYQYRKIDDENNDETGSSFSSSSDEPLLCLFTTFKPSSSKFKIYENVLRNWALLGPRVQPILFTTDGDQAQSNVTSSFDYRPNFTLAEIAVQLDWQVRVLIYINF